MKLKRNLLIIIMLLSQANLVTKPDFDNKPVILNRKINSNKTKYLLVENELKNYQDLIQLILEVKVILKEMENYLLFQPMYRYLNIFIFGDLKVCQIKGLILLLHLISVLLQN